MTKSTILPLHNNRQTPTSTNHTPPVDPSAEKQLPPYKGLGYPAYCKYIELDNDNFLFRRFGALNARVLLSLQHDIIAKEDQLTSLDKDCIEDTRSNTDLNNLSWDKKEGNRHPQRAILVRELQRLLHMYNKYLVTYSILREKEEARDNQVQNLKTWLKNNSTKDVYDSGPIRDEEQYYLDTGSDLICLAGKSKDALSLFLGRRKVVQRLFQTKSKIPKELGNTTTLYDGAGVEWLSTLIAVIFGLLMLYGPMWWLNYVSNDAKRLAIITIFVFFFAMGVGSIQAGRPFETLGATAAYAAVLMVFMQMGPR